MAPRQLYWIMFVAAFFAVALWESFAPSRPLATSTSRRWGNHALLFCVTAALQTAAVRLLPVGAATLVQSSGLGLLNQASVPFWFRFVVTIFLLDLLQYWIHRTYHTFGMLWRVHAVHHSDTDYDVSTAVRFHPLELLPAQALHVGAVLLLAPPPIAVLCSELVAMLVNFAVHANAALPRAVESILGKVFVTPGLHRIHHSDNPADHGRNFGQTFAIWDRLFGTFAAEAREKDFSTGVKDGG